MNRENIKIHSKPEAEVDNFCVVSENRFFNIKLRSLKASQINLGIEETLVTLNFGLCNFLLY